jgi:phosphogluconate dehydratase
MSLHPTIHRVTEAIISRSKDSRAAYIHHMRQQFHTGVKRSTLSCGNLAHAFAGCGAADKEVMAAEVLPNIGIVTAYNDMLSAHKPYEQYPEMIRKYARFYGATAQVGGGVPAMCDGVTQGQTGMELSLFSRDVIALSTAVALSHHTFDGVVHLGICDKIVPGLLIGALSFGFLPAVFMPGGPMTSGISNDEKAKVRRDYAQGLIGRKELLASEAAAYHSPGTCTFYGTANSNQMLMEIMGLQLPGSSFVNPGTPLRELLNQEAVKVLLERVREQDFDATLAGMLNEKVMVNAMVGLLSTGGSTNHTIHLMAIALAAGIHVNWDDIDALSSCVPLLSRVYPNGSADVNHFHASGGMGFLIRTLLDNGLLHRDVRTITGSDLTGYIREPFINTDGQLEWREGTETSLDESVLRPANRPFSPTGGLVLLKGNVGRAIIKTAAVAPKDMVIEAPAMVFDSQNDLIDAFKKGELYRDFIAVLPFQGPGFNGMPELHQLTPTLSVLQISGYKVALVTDGRMSGASGKVPAAIHVVPEAAKGGLLSKIQTGDMMRLDAINGELECLEAQVHHRTPRTPQPPTYGMGRELFVSLKNNITNSESGASFILGNHI